MHAFRTCLSAHCEATNLPTCMSSLQAARLTSCSACCGVRSAVRPRINLQAEAQTKSANLACVLACTSKSTTCTRVACPQAHRQFVLQRTTQVQALLLRTQHGRNKRITLWLWLVQLWQQRQSQLGPCPNPPAYSPVELGKGAPLCRLHHISDEFVSVSYRSRKSHHNQGLIVP